MAAKPVKSAGFRPKGGGEPPSFCLPPPANLEKILRTKPARESLRSRTKISDPNQSENQAQNQFANQTGSRVELEPNRTRRRPIATLFSLPRFADERGALVAISLAEAMPFLPVRCFFVNDVAPGTIRGRHAHRECHQGLVCVSGEALIKLDDGFQTAEFKLASPGEALHIPPLVWGTQTYVAPNTSLLVFASGPYDRTEYISDYHEFIAATRGAR